MNSNILICKRCLKPFVQLNRELRCQSKECKKIPTEVKNKISNGRKKYLNENPDKHPWILNRNKSNPCENVKKFLRSKNIEFVEEYRPLTNRLFSIDIAFPNLKIGLEINGNQHYTKDGILTKYYQERHDLIKKAGWKIIEIHFSLCYDVKNLENIINFNYPHNHAELIKKYKNKVKDVKNNITNQQSRIRNTDLYWEPLKHKIFEANIDFSKFGWVVKVSKVLNIRTQKVNSWMKRYHSDFYENKCFKKITA
jgi:very-short-patch-repair endonuclease